MIQNSDFDIVLISGGIAVIATAALAIGEHIKQMATEYFEL